MAFLPLRKIAEPAVTGFGRDWIEQLTSELDDRDCDRALLCRRTLTELTFPQYLANWETAVNDPGLPYATRLALASTDPRNVTLEPEYYNECDEARFQRVKPLLWLWYSFDRTVAGAEAGGGGFSRGAEPYAAHWRGWQIISRFDGGYVPAPDQHHSAEQGGVREKRAGRWTQAPR